MTTVVPRTSAATHHLQGRELSLERFLPAPAARVFDAWMDAARLCRWYGPAGATAHDARVEARAGGRWQVRIRHADGAEQVLDGQVVELSAPQRMVITVNAGARAGHAAVTFQQVVSLDAVEGGTRVRVVHRHGTEDAARAQHDAGVGAGLAEALDRLELILLLENPTPTMLTLARVLPAPRERVFAALSNPEALDAWWGPDGFVTTTRSMDFRQGGEWRFTMVHAQYGTFPNRALWTLIQPPERMDFLHDDGTGEGGHRAVLWLEAVSGQSTRIHLCQFHPSVEARAHVEGFGAVELGGQTLRKLSEWVATHG